jgi:TolA-binding protein
MKIRHRDWWPRTAIRLGSPGAAVLSGLVLTGCSAIHGQSAPAPAPQSSKPISNSSTHFQSALGLLRAGRSAEAAAELHSYLEAVPESRQARYLLNQIETPIDRLYPRENFAIKLAHHQSLSEVARLYLGNSLGFYGLARYNGIAVPSRVREGQTIRVPKTPISTSVNAQAEAASPALKETTADETAVPNDIGVASHTLPTDMSASKADAHQRAEPLYRAGLAAFQKQDLDSAIRDWKKALRLDPKLQDAQISLSQAEKLKANLKKLRQH